MEFVRVFMEDANRKIDTVSQLREKVAMLESEKQLYALETRVTDYAKQLVDKDTEIQRLLGELAAARLPSGQSHQTENERANATTAVQEALDQRRIAAAAVEALREMTVQHEVCARVL